MPTVRIWKPLGLPALSTSVGLKCLRANVDLPDPEGPMRTTRESSGIMQIDGAIYLTLHTARTLQEPQVLEWK